MAPARIALALLAAAAAFAAAPHCSISGRVFDPAGHPVPFAAVNAIGAPRPSGPPALFGASTDERGEYCISVSSGGGALPPGPYRLRAYARTRPPSASPSCATCCRAATDLAPAFHPAVTLEPGRPLAGIVLRLRRAPVYCVRGEVRGPLGAPLDGAPLRLIMEGLDTNAGVLTERGRFLLTNLLPGSYTLVLLGPTLGDVLATRAFQITNRNLDGLIIQPPAASSFPPRRTP